MIYKAEVRIQLKPGVMDAEGETVQRSFRLLGFSVRSVNSVRVYVIELDANSEDDARAKAVDMCKRLLANPVIQDYFIKIEGG